jgi:hypothetical protein
MFSSSQPLLKIISLKTCFVFALLVSYAACGQDTNLPAQKDRWVITPDTAIEWKIVGRLPHNDHIEMSGKKVSLWMQYGVDSNARPVLNRTIVFPTYRLLPERTIAHMMYDVKDAELPRILINDKLYKAGVYNASWQNDYFEKVVSIRQKGITEIFSILAKDSSVKMHRSFFPSVDKPMALEKFVITNNGKQPLKVELEYMFRETKTPPEKSSGSVHSFIVTTIDHGVRTIAQGDSTSFAICYQAINRPQEPIVPDYTAEELARKQRVREIQSHLILQTPDTILNTMFAFAKLRATESIFETKGGLMHSPGGLRYYAAIWANDQAEYVNPFFGFLGDETGNRSAMNAYRLFARYMNPDYKPIPSSIISEGEGTWHGAGDRGDMAMIAYGAGRYALSFGNRDSARVLWPLIEWCLEYCRRKLNNEGVVWSNKDELEGRFPSGDANLNTSSLYYDALLSASYLSRMLNEPSSKAIDYQRRANEMRKNIEFFFGHKVEGYDTYRYYKGNDTLRAWITTPLTVDIFERKAGTIAALFSPRLWTEDGLASLAGNQTFWDRSTLYGLRGVFAAGETEKALRFLKYYSQRRLVGEHVPYAVEAYPEGNQRHLSAESGLYCRIYTEGMFGIRPTGFREFDITPHLPKEWNRMALKNIHAFENVFDIEVERKMKNKLLVTITNQGREKTYLINEGTKKRIHLD